MNQKNMESAVLKENGADTKSEYPKYQALGGIINEGDYTNALVGISEKMKEFTDMSEMLKSQAEAGKMITEAEREELQKLSIQMTPVKIMADAAGISLESDEALVSVVGTELGAVKFAKDKRAALFGILRGDTNTSGAEHHHSQMNDQNLFAEALRMSGDEESLKKLAEAYPDISFEYGKEKE